MSKYFTYLFNLSHYQFNTPKSFMIVTWKGVDGLQYEDQIRNEWE